MTDMLDLAEIALKIVDKSITKPSSRKNFSKKQKNLTFKNQNYRCNHCNRVLDVINFDHVDGDSSNNSLSNCQALCPNCHAKKTRKIRNRKIKLFQLVRKINQYLS